MIESAGSAATGSDPAPILVGERGEGREAWSFRPTRVDIGVGPGGRALVAPSPTADAPPSRSTTGGLAEGLDQADFARGLGRGGPVLAGVEAAAHSSAAPAFGIATFTVDIRSDGTFSIALGSASSDRAAWERLRPVIQAELASRALRAPPNARGVRVTVRVEASEQFPSGARPPPPNTTGLAVKASAGKLTETKDHVDIELPVAALVYQSRNCTAAIGISAGGIGGGAGCEVEVALRVVQARIVSEERL